MLSEPTTKMVARASVRIRKEKSLESKEVAILDTGAIVEVIETKDGWHKVENGFIKEEYLKLA